MFKFSQILQIYKYAINNIYSFPSTYTEVAIYIFYPITQENYVHPSDGLSATSIVVCNCNTNQCNSNDVMVANLYVMVANF